MAATADSSHLPPLGVHRVAIGFIPDGQSATVAASSSPLRAAERVELGDRAVVRELTRRLAEVAERARERMDRRGELDAASQDGFTGRRRHGGDPGRVPPGQYVTDDFPVLSAGPTPQTPLDDWSFTIDGAVEQAASWRWDEFLTLPSERITADIHCVTKWSKLDTSWTGVSLDTLLESVVTAAKFVTGRCDGGYTTNLALGDVMDGKAWVAYEYEGGQVHPEHGGPARLLVPHLYFWKSAKWIRGLTLTAADEHGFWENHGYHNRGDPWLEQRYQGD